MSDLFQQDAENALLSIIMNNPELVYQVQNIKEYMFSSSPNQNLWRVIQETLKAGIQLTPRYLSVALASRNKEDAVGGTDYVNQLSRMSFEPANLVEYERIVIDNFKRQKLMSLGNELSKGMHLGEDVELTINKVRHSLDSLTETIGNSNTYTLEFALKEAIEDIKKRVADPGSLRGITTGFKHIDQITYGMCEGKLWFISGRPSMGKSSVAENFALHQASLNIPSLFFSLEMNKRDISERLVAIETGLELSKIKLGLLEPRQIELIESAYNKIHSYPLFIDDNFGANLNYILATSRRYAKVYGVKTIYVDYIQLMTERNSEATNELGNISRSLKLLSKELGVCIVVLSQLNRLVETREGDKRPILSDLRQSGNLEEDADIVVGLYRDEVYDKNTKHKNKMEFIVSKNRDGAIGMIPLIFNPNICKLGEDN